jgi:hypothetical protein
LVFISGVIALVLHQIWSLLKQNCYGLFFNLENMECK